MPSIDLYHNALLITLLVALTYLVLQEMPRALRHLLRVIMESEKKEPVNYLIQSARYIFPLLALIMVTSGAIGFIAFDKRSQLSQQPETAQCDPNALCAKIDSLALTLAGKHEKESGHEALKEFKDRIKELGEKLEKAGENNVPVNEPRSSRPSALSLTMIILGLFTFILFAASGLFGADMSNWKAIGAVSSLLTLSGVGLFGIENFRGEFRLFERRIVNAPNYPQGDLVAIPRVGIEQLGAIRNFQVGRHDRFNAVDLEALKKSVLDKRVTVLFLIGEVDRRELRDHAKKIYGSNLSLARARAEHIKEVLAEFCEAHKISVITMNRGALYTGDEDIEQKFSDDRQVVVYGLTTSFQ